MARMSKMRIFRLFFPILMELAIAGGLGACAQQDRLEETLASFGYVIKASESVEPRDSYKEEYQTLATRVIRIKAIQPLGQGGRESTFYRFTVVVERYADAERAKKRFVEASVPPWDGDYGAQKLIWTEFQHGKDVYFVTSDVGIFRDEMKRIAKALEASLQ
jgi:hypothetical protein